MKTAVELYETAKKKREEEKKIWNPYVDKLVEGISERLAEEAGRGKYSTLISLQQRIEEANCPDSLYGEIKKETENRLKVLGFLVSPARYGHILIEWNYAEI